MTDWHARGTVGTGKKNQTHSTEYDLLNTDRPHTGDHFPIYPHKLSLNFTLTLKLILTLTLNLSLTLNLILNLSLILTLTLTLSAQLDHNKS